MFEKSKGNTAARAMNRAGFKVCMGGEYHTREGVKLKCFLTDHCPLSCLGIFSTCGESQRSATHEMAFS